MVYTKKLLSQWVKCVPFSVNAVRIFIPSGLDHHVNEYEEALVAYKKNKLPKWVEHAYPDLAFIRTINHI